MKKRWGKTDPSIQIAMPWAREAYRERGLASDKGGRLTCTPAHLPLFLPSLFHCHFQRATAEIFKNDREHSLGRGRRDETQNRNMSWKRRQTTREAKRRKEITNRMRGKKKKLWLWYQVKQQREWREMKGAIQNQSQDPPFMDIAQSENEWKGKKMKWLFRKFGKWKVFLRVSS